MFVFNFCHWNKCKALKLLIELGLFEDPYLYCNEEQEKEITGSKEMMDAALEVAKKIDCTFKK